MEDFDQTFGLEKRSSPRAESTASGQVLQGNLYSSFIAVAAATLAISTIALCYTVAVSKGDVEPFPNTDITHCALHAPERYFFRIGMLPACTVMIYMWWVCMNWVTAIDGLVDYQGVPESGSWAVRLLAAVSTCKCCTSAQSVAFVLGSLGAMCLIVASSVLEADNGDDCETLWTIHIFCASTFFLLTILAQAIITVKLKIVSLYYFPAVISYASMSFKVLLSALAVGFLLVDALISTLSAPSQYTNALEWIEVAFICAYFFTFAADWSKQVLVATTVYTPPPGLVQEDTIPAVEPSIAP